MSEHPPTKPKKGALHHEHRSARWEPAACVAHGRKPCPMHDEASGVSPRELAEKGLHPAHGFQETCEACHRVKQPGHQPDCQACAETWAATRAHIVAVQAHDEDTKIRAGGG